MLKLGSCRPVYLVGSPGSQGCRVRHEVGALPKVAFCFYTFQFQMETAMTRKYIDCREFPSEMNCTVALSADSDQELVDAAVQHAVAVHGHQDTAELRSQLRSMFKEGSPPMEMRKAA